MWRKVIFIWLSVFSGTTLVTMFPSCTSCGFNSPGAYEQYYKSIEGEPKKMSGRTANGGQFLLDTYQSDTVSYDSIGILVSHSEIALHIQKATGGFMSPSFACDPGVNYETLTNLTIVSDQNYTADFPAGSDLRSIMGFHKDN